MLQDVQKVGDLHAGMAGDEMQHPVMRAPEAELGQRLVGVADEVPVGEEQQLDQVEDRLAGLPGRSGVGRIDAVADRGDGHSASDLGQHY